MRRVIVLLTCVLAGAACGGTITVDDDGPADYTSIQRAIDAAAQGDTIIVKSGTYREKIRFKGRAVLVTSKEPETPSVVASTIINGSSDYSVRFDFGERSGSILEGFTVTGGGVFCYASSPTISKCVIRDCPNVGINGSDGAAPAIRDSMITGSRSWGIASCNGPIVGNIISGNGGGLSDCDGPILDNLISGNHSDTLGFGGGLYCCDGDIAGNEISHNRATFSGGGLYRCLGNITGNFIIGNEVLYEGAGLWACGGTISYNIISGNRCHDGAGLHGCRDVIVNNTIVGNRAEIGAAMRNCTGVVKNNIVAYNEAAQAGGIYGVAGNSYNVFWSNSGGNVGGGAAPGVGDVEADPLFASVGYWDSNGTGDVDDDFWVDGDYHVRSQAGRWDPVTEKWMKDTATSPCVDGGDPDSDWKGELWPHGRRVNVGVYGGTAQASMSLSTVGNVADLNFDEHVDWADLRLFSQMWLLEEVLQREDLNRDGRVDFEDFAILTKNWRVEPRPPVPNPMSWVKVPYATSETTISMEATTATSTDGTSVEYYFEDVDHPEFNSGWQTGAAWGDKGLLPDSVYSYRVKARNKGNLLETGWSETRSARTQAATPPTPDPMTWAQEPSVTSATTITMTATTATSSDGSGVEYYFENMSVGGHNSGWQTAASYTDAGLTPSTQYSYRAKARNKANQRETGWSPVRSATTLPPPDVSPPSPNPMRWAVGGEPKKVLKPPYNQWAYWAEMTAEEATDPSGVEYRFVCENDDRFSSGWQSSRTYSVQIGQQGYLVRFYVVARDKSPSHNQTQPSPTLPWQ